MFCSQCGKEVKDGINFCINCGAPIAKIQINVDDEEAVPVMRTDGNSKNMGQVSQSKSVDDNIVPQFSGMQIESQVKSKNGGMIAVIILLVMIIMGTGFASFWFLIGKDMFSKPAIASVDKDDWESDEEDLIDDETDSWNGNSEEENNDALVEDETEEADYEDEEDDSELYDEYEDDATDSEYILFNSDSAYLTKKDLKGLSAEQCRIARNEIYARHGRMFDDEELQAYFDRQSWYTPSIAPEDFDESLLNDYEVANRDLIVEYETKKGYR